MRLACAGLFLSVGVHWASGQANPPPELGSAGDRIVNLPPMIVEGLARNGPVWRHAEFPGCEILSCCEDETTRAFIARTTSQHALLAELVPERFQRHTAVPALFILLSQKFARTMSAEIVEEMRRIGSRHGWANGGTSLRSMPQLRLTEVDSDASFFMLEELNQHSLFGHPGSERPDRDPAEAFDDVQLAPELVAFLVSNRTPPLPTWFTVGLVRLYAQTILSEDVILIEPAHWSTDDAGERLRQNSRGPRTLLPLGELFHPRLAPAERPDPFPAYRSLWADETSLFLRWVFDERDGSRRAALWLFLDTIGPAGPAEAQFRACFGLGYADVRDQLSDYLPVAVGRQVHWRPTIRPVNPEFELRPAAPEEIHRIKGEWERREVRFIQTQYPQFLPHYIEQAQGTLNRAYASGDRDPRLLASLGLLEAETDDAQSAVGHLASAVAGGVVRPSAAVQLAALRLALLEGHPLGQPGDRPLSAEQAAGILQPLWPIFGQDPPQRDAYVVLAEVMRLGPPPPPAAWRAALGQGARSFPMATSLVLAAAYWAERLGDPREATELLVAGLPWTDRATRPGFLAALERLPPLTPAPGAPPPTDPWAEALPAGSVDPRDRVDVGLSPDGRYLAYLAPFGAPVDRLILVDLQHPGTAHEVPLGAVIRPPAPPVPGRRGGANRAPARPPSDRRPPELRWLSADRLAVAPGGPAAFAVHADGTGREALSRTETAAFAANPARPAGPAPVVDRRSRLVVGTRLPTALGRTYWTDPQLEAIQAELERKLPNRRVLILDWNEGRSRSLVVAETADGRGRCFVYQRPENLLMEVPLVGPAS